jgi:hypothetical protein
MAIQTKSRKEITLSKGNGHAAAAEGLSTGNGQAIAQPLTGLVRAVMADELGADLVKGKLADVTEGHKESLNLWLDGYKADVVRQVESYAQRLLNEQRKRSSEVALAIGEPIEPPSAICPAGYTAFDVLSFSPLELFSGPLMPASNPDKILRGTNFGTPNVTIAAHLAVVFINPVPSIPCGFAVPPTIQLGGRTLRVGFDVMNVTTVAPGLSAAFVLPLPGPAPALIFVPFFFLVPGVVSP